MDQPKRVCELPIHTYLNDGLGDSLFIDGKRQWSDPARFYNNYSDFDFNFPYRSMVVLFHSAKGPSFQPATILNQASSYDGPLQNKAANSEHTNYSPDVHSADAHKVLPLPA